MLLCGSCQLSLRVKDSSKSQERLTQYWLQTSLFAGQFYGDDELTLVDFRPFFALKAEGLSPPLIKRIIPVGTLVKIVRVSHPQKSPRSEHGPKNNIWVHLLVAKDRGLVSFFEEKEHILVLPSKVRTKEEVKAYLAELLTKKDPNLWLLPLPSHIQAGIFNKRPVFGMGKRELKAALGSPEKTLNRKVDGLLQEEWHYPSFFVVLNDKIVSRIRSLEPDQF